eukprot:3535352-Rhodomonas_salina.1
MLAPPEDANDSCLRVEETVLEERGCARTCTGTELGYECTTERCYGTELGYASTCCGTERGYEKVGCGTERVVRENLLRLAVVLSSGMWYGSHGDSHLPSSHTCFNAVDIPCYSSQQVLYCPTRCLRHVQYCPTHCLRPVQYRPTHCLHNVQYCPMRCPGRSGHTVSRIAYVAQY